jgi:hypothetical protein
MSPLSNLAVYLRLLEMARIGTIRIDTFDATLTETMAVLRDKFDWRGCRLHFTGLEFRKLANVVQPTQTFNVADILMTTGFWSAP